MRPLDRLGRGLRTPFLQGAAVYVLFLLVSLVARRAAPAAPLLAGAAAVTLYSVTGPLALAMAPSFWRPLLSTLGTWLGLFVAVAATCEKMMGRVGDDAMVFLGAFMVFPVALLGAGAVRLALRRRRAAAPPPGIQ